MQATISNDSNLMVSLYCARQLFLGRHVKLMELSFLILRPFITFFALHAISIYNVIEENPKGMMGRAVALYLF